MRKENGAETIFEEIILRVLQNDERQQLTDSKNLENPKQNDYKGNIFAHQYKSTETCDKEKNLKRNKRVEKDTLLLKE